MKFDRDLVLKVVQAIWGSSLVELGSAIALIGAAALTSMVQYVVIAAGRHVGHAITIPETPAWLGLTLVAIGVGTASLGAYWQGPLPPPLPNPHDVALLRRFRGLFSEGLLDLLRNHDFSESFKPDRLAPVSEVAAWQGARFEFVDRLMEGAFAQIRQAAGELADAVGIETYPHRVQPHMQTVFADDFDGWNVPDRTKAAITRLNSASTALSRAIDDFERVAKGRIPLV